MSISQCTTTGTTAIPTRLSLWAIKVDKVSYHLVKSTHECLFKAIAACKPGVRYRDMGNIISKHAHSQGLSVGKSYCGHGINTLFHTAPNVPHYEKNKAAGVLVKIK
jgi:methionyl aminopeptidase